MLRPEISPDKIPDLIGKDVPRIDAREKVTGAATFADDIEFGPRLLYSEGDLFNFGVVRIGRDADGIVRLRAHIRGRDGSPRPGSELMLEARPR